ncbi:basic blue protein-like [Malania oleifera]|uniref:basic blue protein-like n=1 Tax=Malania oleifera TaxID=397392 RepID=UPI0025ADA802|nr:basic blue protein-like [Malania oleifera]
MEEEIELCFRYFKFLNILILISFLCLDTASSEVYTVGDEDGWDTGSNFLTWSQRYNFSAGDDLVFQYVKGQHNAYDVTEATYQSCNASSGVLAKYESGNDQVKLTKAKKYWFICNIGGHCLGGMRFAIDVKAASTISNSTNTTNDASTPGIGTTPPPNLEKSYASRRNSIVICLIGLVREILPKMY